MKTKEEVIKAAYGNYSDIALEICDANGWINIGNYYSYFPQDKEQKKFFNELMARPSSLQGIEDNNGWTKIESEQDLPIIDTSCFIIRDSRIVIDIYSSKLKDFVRNSKTIVTHYQPINTPKPPIY